MLKAVPQGRLLINAANLHVGGGVQVASSFLFELNKQPNASKDLSVTASVEVDNSLTSIGVHTNSFADYEICNVHGFNFWGRKTNRELDRFDRVFTVFGPLYRWRTPFKSIVGFAQPWIIYPNNDCYRMLSLPQRLKARVKYWIQGQFFKRADVLVVELEHVKRRLIDVLNIPASRICVVRNAISSVYLNKAEWQPVFFPKTDGFLRLGFLGRNYLHKNTGMFPDIVAILNEKYGIKSRIYVTFTEQEWAACTAEFRQACINVGPLSVAQCPSFYQELDGVVFPSLLECFSATPLEAMVMEKPLFASDRPFNIDICGNHAHYFDPLSPESLAKSIANLFISDGQNQADLRAAREHALAFSSPKDRAEKYLTLLVRDDLKNKIPID